MNINYQYIDELIIKCLRQEASPEERKTLLNILKYSEDPVLNEKVAAAFSASQVETTPSDKVWQQIVLSTSKSSTRSTVTRLVPQILKYVAAVALFLSLPLYLYKQQQSTKQHEVLDKQEIVELNYEKDTKVLPSTSTEIQLELASGKIIDLMSKDTARVVTNDGNVTVVKQGDKLQYIAATTVSKSDDVVVFHRVKVPFGKRLTVELVDGSQIELNSGSELKYPVRGNSNRMDLYLKGEGFFDVAHVPSRLFNVHVDGFGRRRDYNVQVLGTQFNIKSFPEDMSSKTTLFTGSIQLTGLGKNAVPLKPNMEVDVEKGYEIGSADLESAIAWRKGDFL